jgi:hypothetical protein
VPSLSMPATAWIKPRPLVNGQPGNRTDQHA